MPYNIDHGVEQDNAIWNNLFYLGIWAACHSFFARDSVKESSFIASYIFLFIIEATHITLMEYVHIHSFRASGEFRDKIIKIGVRKECSWYELTKALHHEGYTEASGKTTLRLSIFFPPSQCSQKLGSHE